MFVHKGSIESLWLLVLILSICLTNARQIRYSRYNSEVIEESKDSQNKTNVDNNQTMYSGDEIEATVREIKLAPYPASEYKPLREFPLPSDAVARNEWKDVETQAIDEKFMVTTTEIMDFVTTTQGYDSKITTAINNMEDNNGNVEGADMLIESDTSNASYLADDFKPRIPFILPSDNSLRQKQLQAGMENLTEILSEMHGERKIKPPYPAAGYRPPKPFFLPTKQLQQENEKRESKNDNSNHPVCGSSTNPLAPQPLGEGKEDPNSESIYVNTQVQQKFQQQHAVVIPVHFSVHPLVLTRPLVYSVPIRA